MVKKDSREDSHHIDKQSDKSRSKRVLDVNDGRATHVDAVKLSSTFILLGYRYIYEHAIKKLKRSKVQGILISVERKGREKTQPGRVQFWITGFVLRWIFRFICY